MTEETNNESEQSPEIEEEKPTLLVVEDDRDLLEFVISGLNDKYDVVSAVNGEEGLKKARHVVPDLIVTDLMMPIMDGVEMSRELKISKETSHIPIIMLTAKTSLENQLEGLSVGADDYMTKPFHMVLLEARINNLLHSRKMLCEQFSKQFSMTEEQPFLENAMDREFVEEAVRVVESNYVNSKFRPEDLASGLNLNLRTLQRKLKAVADRTPAGFINEYRMMHAAKLLASTSKKVTEIAGLVGCDEPSHFTRMFKKFYDITPLKYRSSHRYS
jgi:YesN/AraC family two-component response regulator